MRNNCSHETVDEVKLYFDKRNLNVHLYSLIKRLNSTKTRVVYCENLF